MPDFNMHLIGFKLVRLCILSEFGIHFFASYRIKVFLQGEEYR